MEFNLALILVSLTAGSGLVVAFNRFYYQRLVAEGRAYPVPGIDTLIEYSRSFFPVLLFVLVIRSFIFEPFRIPSGSMMPTLVQGDFIFVKKFSYGLRLPVLETKIIDMGEPERGDVVVFRLPSDPSINYIKRVIGLPGDEIVYRNHTLTINGEPVETRASDIVEIRGNDLYVNDELIMEMGRSNSMSGVGMVPRTEHLDDRQHEILLQSGAYNDRDGVYTVPAGHYFMMGDNRDHSKDSRYIGAIPETNLVGEAVLIWMHMDGLKWPNWGRIGTSIQ